MSTTDTSIFDQVHTPGQKFSISDRAALAFGSVVILGMYATIFAVALITLSLVEIRQVNMVNFDALIAALEQRDRALDEKTGLTQLLESVRKQRENYYDRIAHSASCVPVHGSILVDDQNNQDRGAVPDDTNGNSKSRPQPRSCVEIQDTIINHANELQIVEDDLMFKQANIESYYLKYVDGITQKMPQIIPALRFLDSRRILINSWARSSFELMEMLLLVSMGMLGGMINVTRWLVDSSSRSPSLLAYFYKPAVGGAIALGSFVVFRASQLIVGGQIQDGPATITASIYLLAALGLVSGFCADKALRQIELAADRLFRSRFPSVSEETPDPTGRHSVSGVRAGR